MTNTFKYNELNRAAYLPMYIRKRSINNTKRNNRRNNNVYSPPQPKLDHVMPPQHSANIPNGRTSIISSIPMSMPTSMPITRFIAKTGRRNLTRKTQATINREIAKLHSEKSARQANLRSKGLIMSRNERNRFAAREAKIRSQK